MEGRHLLRPLNRRRKLAHRRIHAQRTRRLSTPDLEKSVCVFSAPEARRAARARLATRRAAQQQMTAIGRRALMARAGNDPARRAVDGFGAPRSSREIFGIVGATLNRKEGVSFLLAEQNTNIALRFADYGYILENRPCRNGWNRGRSCRATKDVKRVLPWACPPAPARITPRDAKHYRRRKALAGVNARIHSEMLNSGFAVSES